MTVPSPAPLTIRSCHSLAEFHACVALQRVIWGEDPLEVEPVSLFVVAAHTGGQVLGAFAGDVLVGFVLAVAGVRDGRPYLHSHMAGVSASFRDRGIGRELKLFQRQEALERGIRLIRWTFDPLEIRNAHFNFNRLGAFARQYLPNLYGVTSSPLHRGLRTDRLVAEWHLESPRVLAMMDNEGDASPGVANPVAAVDAVAADPAPADSVRIAVPAHIPYGLAGDTSSVTTLQDRLQREFTAHFARGYAATTLIPGTHPAYVLTPTSQPDAGGVQA